MNIGYSFVGDFLAIILCIMSICILKFTYTSKRINLKLMGCALIIIICSSAQNIVLHTMLNFPIDSMFKVIIFFSLQNSVLIGLSILLLIMQEYVLNLSLIGKSGKIWSRIIFGLIILAYSLYKFYSPLHGMDIYFDQANKTIVNYGLQDNLFIYIYGILALNIVYSLFKCRKRILPSAYYTILASSTLSFTIMLVSFFLNNFTFVCFSYTLPVLSVLFIYHHQTQDVNTGALDLQSYNSYMEEAKYLPLAFFHLKLSNTIFDNDQLLAKSFASYIKEMFGNTKYQLFRISEDDFILIYLKQEMSDNALSILEARVKMGLDLLKHKWHTDYRLIAIDTANITSIKPTEFLGLSKFLLQTQETNTTKICFEDDVQEYLIHTLLKHTLKDIIQHNNLDDERIVVHFQPIIKNNGECRNAEALIRLQIHDKIFHPKQFLPIVHQLECDHFITQSVLYKTCQHIKKLKQDGLDFDKISINVFAEDLIENSKHQNLLYIVEKLNDMNFDHIAFEILETPGSFDSDELVKTMIILKSITSVEFYLDDYGTGYSNLLRLLLLPISVVKFDRQILWGARNSDKAFLTAKTSIETFKNLDLKIAMEGVATPEDIEVCKKLGIDYYQGYELAKPGDVTILYDFFKKAEQ